MKADEILKKHEDENEMHFHEIDRKWIIEAMEEYAALRQPLVMRLFTACPRCGSDKIYFESWWTCHECTHDWGGK
jgi:uncharacterized protein (DUF983 family)